MCSIVWFSAEKLFLHFVAANSLYVKQFLCMFRSRTKCAKKEKTNDFGQTFFFYFCFHISNSFGSFIFLLVCSMENGQAYWCIEGILIAAVDFKFDGRLLSMINNAINE